MPAEWKRTKPNEILETDDACTILQKQFNQRIVADKYPYFFIYNYLSLKQEFDKIYKNADYITYIDFSIHLSEIISKYRNQETLSTEEQIILNKFFENSPVSYAPSMMNKLCWQLEDKLNRNKKDRPEFDYTCLLSGNKINKRFKQEISVLYDEFKRKSQEIQLQVNQHIINKDKYAECYAILRTWFKKQVYSVCNNADMVADILIELCYPHANSKQFAWDMCGEYIIRNLLQKHNNLISYPVQDKDGDIEFKGQKFSMRTIEYTSFHGSLWEDIDE